MNQLEKNFERYRKVNTEIIVTQKGIIAEQKKTIKELLEGWRHSLDVWRNQLKTGLIINLMSYVFGLLVGIGITWSVLR